MQLRGAVSLQIGGVFADTYGCEVVAIGGIALTSHVFTRMMGDVDPGGYLRVCHHHLARRLGRFAGSGIPAGV